MLDVPVVLLTRERYPTAVLVLALQVVASMRHPPYFRPPARWRAGAEQATLTGTKLRVWCPKRLRNFVVASLQRARRSLEPSRRRAEQLVRWYVVAA